MDNKKPIPAPKPVNTGSIIPDKYSDRGKTSLITPLPPKKK